MVTPVSEMMTPWSPMEPKDWPLKASTSKASAISSSKRMVEGISLRITRAKIVSPLLARPLYPVNANVRIQRNTLYADSFDAKCGPRGSVKVRGAVPVLHTRRGASGETWEGLVARADVQALDAPPTDERFAAWWPPPRPNACAPDREARQRV